MKHMNTNKTNVIKHFLQEKEKKRQEAIAAKEQVSEQFLHAMHFLFLFLALFGFFFYFFLFHVYF